MGLVEVLEGPGHASVGGAAQAGAKVLYTLASAGRTRAGVEVDDVLRFCEGTVEVAHLEVCVGEPGPVEPGFARMLLVAAGDGLGEERLGAMALSEFERTRDRPSQ